jgi:GH24 family phage-related lysozyme (muramidase)
VIALSPAGAAFVAAWEGYRARAYNDSEGNATIGVGHLLHYGPVTQAELALYWPLPYALAVLRADAARNGLDELHQSLHVPLTQGQVDALVCLGFNCGPGSLRADGLVMQAVNGKPRRYRLLAMRAWHQRVRTTMLAWAHPAVLERRRLSEAYLFATGLYRRPLNPYANL